MSYQHIVFNAETSWEAGRISTFLNRWLAAAQFDSDGVYVKYRTNRKRLGLDEHGRITLVITGILLVLRGGTSMRYEIHGRFLTIIVDAEERCFLQLDREENPEFDSDKYRYELFEKLVSNSVLDWIDPSETGDLTDAPMLGIRIAVFGMDDIVTDRWGFMDYQLVSVQQRLLDVGRAVFEQ